MYGSEKSSSVVTKNADFNLPLRRKRDKSYKIASGMVVFTCFTSDFLVEGADKWRADVWAMIRERSDCMFYFFTKRIDRFTECAPDDWGDGYFNSTDTEAEKLDKIKGIFKIDGLCLVAKG